jgi:hypothetical protein
MSGSCDSRKRGSRTGIRTHRGSMRLFGPSFLILSLAVLLSAAAVDAGSRSGRGPAARAPRCHACIAEASPALRFTALALAHPLAHGTQTPCKSACSDRSRKALRASGSDEGSNPSPSANRAGSRREPALRGAPNGVCDRRTQSIEVHGRLRTSTVFAGHWRTTGAPRRPITFLALTTRTGMESAYGVASSGNSMRVLQADLRRRRV